MAVSTTSRADAATRTTLPKGSLWQQVAGADSVRVYGPRVQIIEQGAAPAHVFFVVRGLLKLTYCCEDGRMMVTGLRQRGSLLGATAAILQRPNLVSVTTVTSCELVRIPQARFKGLLCHHDLCSREVHLVHCQELEREQQELVVLGCLSARERLEVYLQLLNAEIGPEEEASRDRTPVPLREWELAQLISVTPQYVCRLLHELADRGRLTRKDGRLYFSGRPLEEHLRDIFN